MSSARDIEREMNRIERANQRAAENGQDMKDVFQYLGDLFSRLGNDLSTLMNLRMDLLKAELQEAGKVLAIDSILVIAGGFLGFFAFSTITLALVGFLAHVLPQEGFLAFGLSALIVGAVYALIAGGLIFAGIRHLQRRGITPERSIEEIERDKQLVKELR